MGTSTGTLVEQILSHKAGRAVRPGDVVTVEVDRVMIHDSIAPTAIRILREDLGARLHDPRRISAVIDHVAPASTIQTATRQQELRAFVGEEGIDDFCESGTGIAHQVLIERGTAAPGRVIVGSDSHSTAYGAVAACGTGMGATDIALAMATGQTWLRVPETIRVRARGRFRDGVGAKDLALHLARVLGADGATYAALEYHGLDFLSVGSRTTLTTMGLEVGAKAAIFPPDGLPDRYPVPAWLRTDPTAAVSREVDVDLEALRPLVAAPHMVDNVRALDDTERVPIDVVYIGTCTNGRHEDMATAARVLTGRRVHPRVRLIVVPASRAELQAAVDDGTVATLLHAGATLGPPGCGACIGRHLGVLAPGETCLFTGNRNFRGRMGAPEADIYLGSPEVAAATAVVGRLAHPDELDSLERRPERQEVAS